MMVGLLGVFAGGRAGLLGFDIDFALRPPRSHVGDTFINCDDEATTAETNVS